MPIDYSKYPPGWFTRIRPEILERDNHQCKFCGLPNGAEVTRVKIFNRVRWFPSFEAFLNSEFYSKNARYKILPTCKVVLTIAHLDHDESNWNIKMDRLAALCQRCHLVYDAQHKATKRKKQFVLRFSKRTRRE